MVPNLQFYTIVVVVAAVVGVVVVVVVVVTVVVGMAYTAIDEREKLSVASVTSIHMLVHPCTSYWKLKCTSSGLPPAP